MKNKVIKAVAVGTLLFTGLLAVNLSPNVESAYASTDCSWWNPQPHCAGGGPGTGGPGPINPGNPTDPGRQPGDNVFSIIVDLDV